MQKFVIKVRFSHGYATFLYGVHGLACLIVGWIEVPVWVKILLILLVIASSYGVSTKAHSILELAHDGKGQWYLQTKTRRNQCVLSSTSLASPYIAILVFKLKNEKKRYPVVLFPDSVEDKTTLRQLTLHLKTSGY